MYISNPQSADQHLKADVELFQFEYVKSMCYRYLPVGVAPMVNVPRGIGSWGGDAPIANTLDKFDKDFAS